MATTDCRGRFLWHELMTTDPKGGQEFYKQVIGWGLENWHGAAGDYAMFKNGDAALAGILELPEEARKMGAPPHWLVYIGVNDVDACVKQATGLGAGTYVPPTDIPEVGRFAVLSDPQGATFAVFTPKGEGSGYEGPPRVGEFSWHELATTDYKAAFAFYNALFGWEKTGDFDMGAMGIYQMYGQAGKTYGGMFNKPAEMPMPSHWLDYIRVPDIQRAAEAIKAGGGKVVTGPMEVPGGDWIVQGTDPQGTFFALHQRKAE